MRFSIGQVCYGFKVVKFEHVDEVAADCYLMEHEKSGARLLYLDSKDDNKVFSIGFRTPPFDDSGVAHILEHSSLCGSRKYHLKEPFVELAKGSLNTFLNAMTYPDKTVYPVASRNDKDFANLVDVYMDAVFYPLIYDNPYTLKQEGWHYEIAGADEPLTYNGVVYNEMKGVYSSPDAYLDFEAMRGLFPDNAYRFESGGYPDAIPDLTQEKFLNFHKTYYSPENSYIFLYGDMDIEVTLRHLAEEYLNNFSKTGKVDSAIAWQKPFAKTKEVTAYYPVEKDSDLKAKTYHELTIVCGDRTDYQTTIALGLLETVLLTSESGPLRRALVDAGIGESVSGEFTSSLRQPTFSIRVSGSEEKHRDQFLSTIYRELERIMRQGLDRRQLEAALNAMEFKLRENNFGPFPKGLIFGLGVMDYWIYDGDPIEGLKVNKRLQILREHLQDHYYEELIETYLLDNPHKVLVTLLPKPGMEEEHADLLQKKMRQIKEDLPNEEIGRLVAECAELHRRQNSPDSPEDLATIPILQRSDIRKNIEKIDRVEETVQNNSFIYLPAETNGIVYLDWEFDITGIDPQYLPYVPLFADLFGRLDTERYTYKELETETVMFTGGINSHWGALSKVNDGDDYTIQFTVKAKCLRANLLKTFDLVKEILLKTKFADLIRFKEIVDEIKNGWDNNFFNRGMEVAAHRLETYIGAWARVNELDEFSYYQLLKDFQEHFAERGEKVLRIMQELAGKVYNRSKVLFVYSCETKDRQDVRKRAAEFISVLGTSDWAGKLPQKLPAGRINEAIPTPGKVQYVVVGGNLRKHGFDYTGALKVLTTVLTYEYLWIKIRVQGGAYGSHARFNSNGSMLLTSYRDPQLVKSLEAYRELPAWLGQKEFSSRELDKYVIGTISSMDMPLTHSMRMDKVVNCTLRKVSKEFQQKIRDQVLGVTGEDLRQLAPLMEAVLQDGYLCVVGGQQVIEENKNLFNDIIKI